MLCALRPDGSPAGPPERVADLAAGISSRERGGGIRWIWASGAALYPRLLRSGVRVARCHDVALTRRLLLARDGGRQAAREHDDQEADDPVGQGPPPGASGRQPTLFDSSDVAAAAAGSPDRHELLTADGAGPGRASTGLAPPGSGPAVPGQPPDVLERDLRALAAAYAGQLTGIAADPWPSRLGLLVTAESACQLAACEMTAAGLPWRAEVHERLLTEALGRRPPASAGQTLRPARLTALIEQITKALGAPRPVNPDSPAQLQRALAAAGVRVSSTRSAALRTLDHPVIPLLLRYKELSRLHSANGWSWLDTWVRDGRFRPDFVVGGVVSGRWASRGGGALQIPRSLRQAVIADPGWTLVVADAAQLEPRVLAALSGDGALAEAAAEGDLYAALAGVFGGDRSKAKVALLSAMYGGTGGAAGQLLSVFRRRFASASDFVETAARAGQEGRVVRSVLGRTCPPPSARWRALTSEPGDPQAPRDPGAGAASRARGRFTRNFVVQASAADWAAVWLAGLRARITDLAPTAGDRPELVFFQHDEVIVHTPARLAGAVAAAVGSAARHAGTLVFGRDCPVSFPVVAAPAECYADAK